MSTKGFNFKQNITFGDSQFLCIYRFIKQERVKEILMKNPTT